MEISGSGVATADISINKSGQVEPGELTWEDFCGMSCDECGGDNVLMIGTGVKYSDAV